MTLTFHRRILALAAATALTQVVLAIVYPGFATGDEVEVLAEALRVAAGFRYRAWDIRNLFVPDFVAAPLLFVAHWLGVASPRVLAVMATVPFVALTAATVVLTARIALRWIGDERAAFVAALLVATHWIPLGYGSATYPRVVAMAAVSAAAWALLRSESRVAALIAGLLVAIAFSDRYSEIVFLAPMVLLARRRWLHVIAGCAAGVVVIAGVYDWITWGAPFASLLKFARLTVVEPDFASRIKYQSPLWYLETLPRWCPVTLLPLFWFSRPRRDASLLVAWSFVIVPHLALSGIRHKELRYLHAVIPFLAILGAWGLARMNARRLGVVLVALSVGLNLAGIRFLLKKSTPAVHAAEAVRADPKLHTIVLSQLWAYGDRVYLGDDRDVRDTGTPPADLGRNLEGADAALLYESDVDGGVRQTLERNGFREVRAFRGGRARDVLMFTRQGIADPSPHEMQR